MRGTFLRSFNSPNPGSSIQHVKHQARKNLTKSVVTWELAKFLCFWPPKQKLVATRQLMFVRVSSGEREAIRDRKSSFLRDHRCCAVGSTRHHDHHRGTDAGTSTSLAWLAQAGARQGGAVSRWCSAHASRPYVTSSSTVVAAARRLTPGTQSCHVRAPYERYLAILFVYFARKYN